jgi:hypothetical protein
MLNNQFGKPTRVSFLARQAATASDTSNKDRDEIPSPHGLPQGSDIVLGQTGIPEGSSRSSRMSAMGHSRPGRASSKSGHVRCAAESGSKFGALATQRRAIVG